MDWRNQGHYAHASTPLIRMEVERKGQNLFCASVKSKDRTQLAGADFSSMYAAQSWCEREYKALLEAELEALGTASLS